MKENPISFPFPRTRASELPRTIHSDSVTDLFSSEIPMQISSRVSQSFDLFCYNFTCQIDGIIQLPDMPRSPLDSVVVMENVPGIH